MHINVYHINVYHSLYAIKDYVKNEMCFSISSAVI